MLSHISQLDVTHNAAMLPHLRCFGLLISTAALCVALTRRRAVIPLPLRVMRIYVILLLPRFSLPFNFNGPTPLSTPLIPHRGGFTKDSVSDMTDSFGFLSLFPIFPS